MGFYTYVIPSCSLTKGKQKGRWNEPVNVYIKEFVIHSLPPYLAQLIGTSLVSERAYQMRLIATERSESASRLNFGRKGIIVIRGRRSESVSLQPQLF